jgi:hypothetical protein
MKLKDFIVYLNKFDPETQLIYFKGSKELSKLEEDVIMESNSLPLAVGISPDKIVIDY